MEQTQKHIAKKLKLLTVTRVKKPGKSGFLEIEITGTIGQTSGTVIGLIG